MLRNQLKQLPGWKIPNLSNHMITITPAKLPWTYSILTSFKTRSFGTQTDNDEDQHLAHQVLDEFPSDFSHKNNPTTSALNELCTTHITQLCNQKKLRAATTFLILFRHKYPVINTLPSYNLLLSAACENNDIKTASRVFKHMLVNHLSMNSTTYFLVAKTVSKTNDLTFVLSFVKEISELTFNLTVIVINRIIYAFSECGQVHNAMLVFDNMKSFKAKPDLVTYNTVLGILGKAGRVDEMLDVLTSMKKDDITPDVVSYNTLFHSLRKAGRFDLCAVLTKEMMKRGLQPDLITYTALIECFFRSGDVEESLRLFEEMKRLNIRPSIYVYRSLISNLKKLGKLELAVEFLEEMDGCRKDLIGPEDFKRRKDRNISCI